LSEEAANLSSDSNGLSASNPESPSPLAKFEKFEEKKRQQTEKRSKTLKNIFKKASFRDNVASSVSSGGSNKKFAIPSFTSSAALGFASKSGGFNYDTLTLSGDSDEPDQKQLNELMSDVKKQVNKFATKISKTVQQNSAPIEELGEQVQDFYGQTSHRFEHEQLYTAMGLSPDQLEQLGDYTERQLLTKLHHLFFARIQAEDEENDLKMQKRIKSLNWITVSAHFSFVRTQN
jgi:hypothetical protein